MLDIHIVFKYTHQHQKIWLEASCPHLELRTNQNQSSIDFKISVQTIVCKLGRALSCPEFHHDGVTQSR